MLHGNAVLAPNHPHNSQHHLHTHAPDSDTNTYYTIHAIDQLSSLQIELIDDALQST
jgi:hypothetical protein